MPDKILSVDAVLALVPYCRMQLFRKVKAGTFPAPLQLGARRIGWRESDITAWQQSLSVVAYAATSVGEVA
ncbi:MAG: AlpA family phage regulatory protein [Rhodospirillales bacterium]|nr:AlpA family phage regulatory protein [Rhodospirillales bacterium]